MSLIKCPECENTVSNKANTCPQCGFPISKTKKRIKRKNIILDIKKNIPLAINKLFESKVFMYLVFLPMIICICIAVWLLGMWLMEQLFEFNSSVGLVTLILGGNILGWFSSYKWGVSKLFFWLCLIVTIAFCITMHDIIF